jgi:hypothetical protein
MTAARAGAGRLLAVRGRRAGGVVAFDRHQLNADVRAAYVDDTQLQRSVIRPSPPASAAADFSDTTALNGEAPRSMP